MKILVLTNLYPPHHAGTFDFRCQSACEALVLRGHNVRVLTSMHGMTHAVREEKVERRLQLNGIYDHPWVLRLRDLQALESANNSALREALSNFSPDLVLVWTLEGLSKSLIFTLRNSRLPVVYQVADAWLLSGVRADPWLRWWNRPAGPWPSRLWRAALEWAGQRNRADGQSPTRLMRGYNRMPDVYGDSAALAKVPPNSISQFRFDRVYFCSRALKEETERAGFRIQHGDILYPGIPTQHFVGDVKAAAEPLEKLLLVSRLHKKSGAMTAVKALQALRVRRLKVTLSIYGRGDSDYIAEMRSYIAQHQLPVEWLNVSNVQRDLPAIYRKHDALLYTAEWSEPFALTPLEAMSCGVPVIGAAIGGARELFRHGENALTYEPGDAEELAARIEELQRQSAQRVRLAEVAQVEVASKYNETAVTDQLEGFLDTSCQVWQHTAS